MAITPRLLCVPTVVIIFAALVISFLTSLSLPAIPTIPIVRTTLGNGTFVVNGTNSQSLLQELRVGIWTACYYHQNTNQTCFRRTLDDPYNVTVVLTNDTSILTDDTPILANGTSTVTVLQSAFRHGLAFKPVATASILILLFFACFIREIMAAIAFWVSLAATILTFISLVLDIITLISVRNGMTSLPSETMPGIGLWLNVVTIGLLILASFMQYRMGIIVDRRRTTITHEHKK